MTLPREQRVVVINDDPVQLQVTVGLLEKRGLHVQRFFAADAALEAMSVDAVPDLIITDLHMPGIDGWKFCRLVRSSNFDRLREVPLMVMSATFSGAEVEALTEELGADAFLPVPCPPQTLLRYVRELLAGERPRAIPTALVVDDDEAVCASLSKSLEAHGWRVLCAPTAADGLQMFEDERPAVVLLDYHLPDVTGTELLVKIRRPAQHSVVLVMTGDTDPRLPVSLMRQGADGYLRKPFDATYVLDLIHGAQRERSLLRVEDILESRTLELRASEARYRVLYGSIPEGILIFDESGRVLQSNAVLQAWLGKSEEALVGASVTDLVVDARKRAMQVGIEGIWATGGGELSTTLRSATGPDVECEVTLRAFAFQGASALLCVCRDVTERNRAEADRRALEGRIQQAQKLESLGVLAGGVAHDFNNLLVGILGNASLAAMDLPPGGPAWESIKQIEVAARRAADLTAQILTYTGKARLSSEILDLSAQVRETAQLLEPAISRKAVLSYDLRQGVPALRGDPAQIRQIIMNLIMNASDALEGERGGIRLRTGVMDADEEYLRSGYLGEEAEAGSFVYMEVEDSGCGMDKTTRDRIFDPFFTTKFAGRGLGLAATLGVVRGHGGAIHVTSQVAGGTTFRVLFPALNGVLVEPPPNLVEREGGRRGTGTILVVDDEDAVRNVAAVALQRFGYQVIPASDGAEALEILGSDREVDAVLLDLSMPGMDGDEVLDALVASNREVPVLLSSGYTEDAVMARLRGKGVAGFVRKPYAPSELVQKLQRVLSGSLDRVALG